jgi:hypothetical protein
MLRLQHLMLLQHKYAAASRVADLIVHIMQTPSLPLHVPLHQAQARACSQCSQRSSCRHHLTLPVSFFRSSLISTTSPDTGAYTSLAACSRARDHHHLQDSIGWCPVHERRNQPLHWALAAATPRCDNNDGQRQAIVGCCCVLLCSAMSDARWQACL